MLDPQEWPLFARHVRMRPWLVPAYSLELLGLVSRRLSQRARLRRQSDPHRGGKRRPEWLKPTAVVAASTSLQLPVFALKGTMPRIDCTQFPEGDPEAIYQRHRWSSCAMALGDEARARLALREALGWISQPPERSHPAWEPYSCCERVANLAILLAAHPSLRPALDEALLGRFFADSAAWIDTHLEYYGPIRTNNHFLNNGRALVLAGCVTNHRPWIEAGLAIVRRFAPELFPKDGCLREGSSHYQLLVSGWLFDVIAFASSAMPLDALRDLESLAQEAGCACARFAATLPDMDQHIGDISPDLHPRLTLARLRLLHGKRLVEAAVGAALGDWLFAERGRAALLARAVRSWPQPHTTHAHADLGGFIWLHAGRAILADAGRRDYLPRPETQAQLGPPAHNTLTVNGVGALAASVLRVGLWYPQPYADACIEVETAADGFVLRHDGFARIAGVGRHRREVRLIDDGLEVIDSVEGSGSAELALHWHFAPDWRDEDEATLVSPSGRLRLAVNGADGARHAWSDYACSGAYGEARPARCLTLVWRAELPCRIHTCMRFEPCAA